MSGSEAAYPGDIPLQGWDLVERAVDAALDALPADRDAVIDCRLGAHPELRDAALAWLHACHRPDDALAEPPDASALLAALHEAAAAPESVDEPCAPAGLHVGGWRLLRELGRGGMGTVHLAERVDAELPMRAALKLMHPFARMDAVGVRRFRDERRFLATLEHPSIARLLDGGVHDGLPWFAMEYVAGEPIDVWCDRQALPVVARIRIFCRVCDAVQHAHARLIVHRDLKPANILVCDAGDPKLLDFGIAKLIDGDEVGPGLTRAGGQPLTPAFAAPEQLRGDTPTTATDVFSLGGLLFLLLTGLSPGTGQDAVPAEPPRPSTAMRARFRRGAVDDRCTRAAAARSTTPSRLARRLSGDLDTIIARAMDPDPQRRYPTAEALAADLRRHLEGRPVLARPDTRAYRLRKLVARHPLGSGSAAVAAVVLLAGATLTTMQANLLRTQAVTLTSERDKATEMTGLLAGILSSADPYKADGQVPTLREVLDRGVEQAAATLHERPEVHAHLLSAMAPAYFGLGDWSRAGDLAEQSVLLRRRAVTPDDRELAAALVYLAMVRMNQGRAAEAEAHVKEALAIRRRAPAGPGIDTMRALSVLGTALSRGGRHDEAEHVLRSLLELERQRTPVVPAGVAQVARNLAHTLRDQGRLEEAALLYAEAYAIHRRLHGDEHPETGNSAVNLGRALVETGQQLRGAELLRSGVATKRRLLGIDHPDVARDQIALADALLRLGERTEADALRREASAVLTGATPP